MPAANGSEGACRGRVFSSRQEHRPREGRGRDSSERKLRGPGDHAPDPGVGACGLERPWRKGERSQLRTRKQALGRWRCVVRW